eukprot:Sspe_Gene.49201::Locus_26264_Transcript_1_1_Confidence_1.000_Length_3811::g.49201::m.49201
MNDSPERVYRYQPRDNAIRRLLEAQARRLAQQSEATPARQFVPVPVEDFEQGLQQSGPEDAPGDANKSLHHISFRAKRDVDIPIDTGQLTGTLSNASSAAHRLKSLLMCLEDGFENRGAEREREEVAGLQESIQQRLDGLCHFMAFLDTMDAGYNHSRTMELHTVLQQQDQEVDRSMMELTSSNVAGDLTQGAKGQLAECRGQVKQMYYNTRAELQQTKQKLQAVEEELALMQNILLEARREAARARQDKAENSQRLLRSADDAVGPISEANLVIVVAQVKNPELPEMWKREAAATFDAVQKAVALMADIARRTGGWIERTSLMVGFQAVFRGAKNALHFCVQVQEELLNIPWPAQLLQFASCRSVSEMEHRGKDVVLWRGLRVGMAAHMCSYKAPYPNIDEATQRTEFAGYDVITAHRLLELAQGGEIIASKGMLAAMHEPWVGAPRSRDVCLLSPCEHFIGNHSHKVLLLDGTPGYRKDVLRLLPASLAFRRRYLAPLRHELDMASLVPFQCSLESLPSMLSIVAGAIASTAVNDTITRRESAVLPLCLDGARSVRFLFPQIIQSVTNVDRPCEERHQVKATVVVFTLSGLVKIVEESPEAAACLVSRIHDLARRTLVFFEEEKLKESGVRDCTLSRASGSTGVILSSTRDEMVLLFARPEDAIRWGVLMQTRLMDLDVPRVIAHTMEGQDSVLWRGPLASVGIHTGTLTTDNHPTTGFATVEGLISDYARALAYAARGGELLCSSAAWDEAAFRSFSKPFGCLLNGDEGVPHKYWVYQVFSSNLTERVSDLPPMESHVLQELKEILHKADRAPEALPSLLFPVTGCDDSEHGEEEESEEPDRPGDHEEVQMAEASTQTEGKRLKDIITEPLLSLKDVQKISAQTSTLPVTMDVSHLHRVTVESTSLSRRQVAAAVRDTIIAIGKGIQKYEEGVAAKIASMSETIRKLEKYKITNMAKEAVQREVERLRQLKGQKANLRDAACNTAEPLGRSGRLEMPETPSTVPLSDQLQALAESSKPDLVNELGLATAVKDMEYAAFEKALDSLRQVWKQARKQCVPPNAFEPRFGKIESPPAPALPTSPLHTSLYSNPFLESQPFSPRPPPKETSHRTVARHKSDGSSPKTTPTRVPLADGPTPRERQMTLDFELPALDVFDSMRQRLPTPKTAKDTIPSLPSLRKRRA